MTIDRDSVYVYLPLVLAGDDAATLTAGQLEAAVGRDPDARTFRAVESYDAETGTALLAVGSGTDVPLVPGVNRAWLHVVDTPEDQIIPAGSFVVT